MNFKKNSLSSGVYLFPRPWGMIVEGGLGEREGGSGTLSSAFGAGKRSSYMGSGAVRLLIVLRRPFNDCADCSVRFVCLERARGGNTGECSVLRLAGEGFLTVCSATLGGFR
jgi:hypothetical protein